LGRHGGACYIADAVEKARPIARIYGLAIAGLYHANEDSPDARPELGQALRAAMPQHLQDWPVMILHSYGGSDWDSDLCWERSPLGSL
jgi:hypothetical protein